MHFNIYLTVVTLLCSVYTSLRTYGIITVEPNVVEDISLATLIIDTTTSSNDFLFSLRTRDSITATKEKNLQKKTRNFSSETYRILYEEPKKNENDLVFTKDSLKEWEAFPRSEWDYNYDIIPYSERELMALTNVIWRESASSSDANRVRDQYMVMLTALRVVQNIKRKKITLTDMLEKGTFQYVTEKYYTSPCYNWDPKIKSEATLNEYKEIWLQCKQVALNVINCNIPKYIPYLPTGTFYYHNSRLDKNVAQRKHLEKTSWCIASSIKDHFYFMQIEYATPKEITYLVENKIENPVAIIPRHCKNGNKELLYQEYQKLK